MYGPNARRLFAAFQEAAQQNWAPAGQNDGPGHHDGRHHGHHDGHQDGGHHGHDGPPAGRGPGMPFGPGRPFGPPMSADDGPGRPDEGPGSEGRRGGRGSRGGPFGGPFGGPRGFGFGGPRGGFGGTFAGFGGPRGSGGGQRARRGDVRSALLSLLTEAPRNGYQLIQAIEEKSGGSWKPSPGAVYPALSQLEDEGLISSDQGAGRREFTLTESGRTYVADHADALAAVWASVGKEPGAAFGELAGVAQQLATAVGQVLYSGDGPLVDGAKEILATARREIYLLLADGGTPGADQDAATWSGHADTGSPAEDQGPATPKA